VTVTPGACVTDRGIDFAVFAPDAERVEFCLFAGAAEQRIAMTRNGDWHVAAVAGIGAGQAYGYRAHGRYAPDQGMWFDPAKLLVDPYATRLDRRFAYHPDLALFGADTAALVPRAIVEVPAAVAPAPPLLRPGGLIYELNVRGFSMLHPAVPEAERGTIRALAHPAVIAHLQALHVDAVELMPIVAWIDERHLPPLGLANAWGYNPVVPMAIDPRLAPGGIADLADTVAALHDAGIGVILDLVFNHNGESDVAGPSLALRGLANRHYFAHDAAGRLINDTGTGNTLNAAEPVVRRLIRDSLRHFVAHAGIDGFRFDLATVLARGPGFDREAPIFAELAADPLLADRIMIAEPWDIGPGGYQLGQFPSHWYEWNDRYRDDVRRFWRGDGRAATLATRLCGSSDIFAGPRSRGVHFIAAHDGFTLADLVAFAERHNHANGEDNRDGHADNLSWNHGAEGPSDDPAVQAARRADLKALLATLFATRGLIQLTAGDEFGRSQQGNNNAYAQDNVLGWIDWAALDQDLLGHAQALAALRAAHPAIGDPAFLDSADWRRLDGDPMTAADWNAGDCPGFELRLPSGAATVVMRIDRPTRRCEISVIARRVGRSC